MNHLILTSLFFASSLFAMSQTTIKGRVLNFQNEIEPFSTIALLNYTDSIIIKGSITTDKGDFEFKNLKEGSYLIKAIVVGGESTFTDKIAVTKIDTEIILPDLIQKKSAIELKSVDVVAIKPLVEFKNGNIILNVENSTIAAGNSAYELLKKAPSVSIDNNNNIAIQGRQGVKIMIDGRLQQLSTEQLANLLQSMPAEGIEKIEIMKNPSVKYDAEGTAGLINIKTKKAKLIGFNGNVNTGISKGELWSGNGGFALNYKGTKYAITSNFNLIQRNRKNTIFLNRKIKTTSNDLIFDQKSVDLKNNLFNDYKIGADWFINGKTTLGIMLDGGTGNPKEKTNNITHILGNNTVGFDNLLAKNDNENTFYNNNLGANANHKIDTLGSEIDASVNYTKYKENGLNKYGNYFNDASENTVLGLYPNIYKNTLKTNIDMLVGAVNYKKALPKKNTTIESGLKYSGVTTNNSLLFERKDTISDNYYNDKKFSNEFLYTEHVGAGYFNFQKVIKKVSMQLGLRAEYTKATGFNKTINTKVIREYLQLFPNVSFDIKASENHNWSAAYNRRINRPDYFQLNPFKFYIDQYTAHEGNPFLNPETSNNINLTHAFKGAIYNTLSYSRTDNSISDLTVQDDSTKETKQVTRNITANNMYAYNFYSYIPYKKWYVAQLDFSAWYQNFEGQVNGVSFNKGLPAMQINLTNEFILPKDFSIELSGKYQSSLQYGLFTLKPQSNIDIGIRKNLFKNKVSIKINASDLFYKSITRVNINFDNQNVVFKEYQDSRRVRLTITYNFGNTKLKFNETKNINEAEKNRLKKN